MHHFYDNKGDISPLQKRWTAYLQIAIRHKRADYLCKLIAIMKTEVELPSSEDDDTYIPLSTGHADVSKEMGNPEEFVLIQQDIKGSLQRLPTASRQIVFSKIFEGKTFRVIAKELCMKEGTVKTLFYKALQEMKGELI